MPTLHFVFDRTTERAADMNALIAQACYVIVGIAAALLSGIDLTIANAIPLITVATLVGQAAYKIVWSNIGTGTDGEAPSLDERITTATSIVK